MAALQCEICGGKLMAKAGGLFECEYCGMQYDKTRIQEMVQEIKGTVKVEGTVEVTGTVKVEGNVSVQNFLKRGQMALTDNKWQDADTYFNQALNIDSECAQAYLGKLLCELRISQIDGLKGRSFPFHISKNYEKFCRFGDAQTKQLLQEYNEQATQAWKRNRARIQPVSNILDASIGFAGVCVDGTLKVPYGIAYQRYQAANRWDGIVAVSVGYFNALGLKSDGTVVSTDEEKTDEISNWRSVISISAGGSHYLGLKADGTVVAAGSNNCGQCEVSNWNNVNEISAGQFHSVGLKADGTVVAVGKNDDGMCDVDSWRDIVAVSAGGFHTLGLKADGTVVSAGSDLTGKCNVENWRDIIAISAGSSHSVGLKADGTVVAVGSNDGGRCNVSGWHNIVAVSAGSQSTLGLKEDGTVIVAGGFGIDGRVSGWKLFEHLDTFEQDRREAMERTTLRKRSEKEFRKYAKIEDGCLVEYRGTDTSIAIPDDITGIYDGAFSECSSLEEINISDSHPYFAVKSGCLIVKETASIKAAFGNPVIPADGSVTQICTYAFSNCKQMTSITIPDCVEEICGGAFAGCTALKDIKISNSHPSYRVRNGCIIDVEEEEIVAGFAYSTIPLDGGVTAIGWMAFENCEGLTTIDIPEGIITIGEDAFCGCKNLRFIFLPNGVENIEHQAFFGCESLSFIEIPESVEFIDEDGSVFKGCNKLTIYAPKGSYAEQWATRHRIPVKENDRFKRERLEKERQSLENELSNLRGLFTGKRRKEIEARLLEIEAELKGLK